MKPFKYFSTFSGIGGFEIGIHNAWLRHASESLHQSTDETGSAEGSLEQRPEFSMEGLACVGYSEIDKYATSVYERNFPDAKNYGDITKINAAELPDFDCLVGGFPCQAFSVAGRRRGFEDTRGTLFFDLARILKEKQPRLFVFENVEGLLSHKKGRTFTTIITTIDELGYDCQWQVVNSKNHGVPQSRKRVIIVGHLRGQPRPQVFPFGRADEKDTRIIGEDVAYAIDASYHKGVGPSLARARRSLVSVGTLRTHKDGNGFREMKSGLVPTIPARAREDGSGQPVIRIAENTKKGYAEATVGDSINLQVLASKTRRGRVGKGMANTIDTTMQQHTLTEDARIRRLTPIECERLQAFPDDWTKHGMGGVLISDTQRYKMCGNAVTTNVIRDVFVRIFQTW